MQIKLPFKYPCIIDTFSGVSNNVGIYMNYPQYYTPLLIANHFLITYSNELDHAGYNWKYYNDDYGYFVDIREEAKRRGVINTIEKYICNKRYIKIILDFYYISKSPWYKIEKNKLHWLPMIIGFDDEKKEVFLCDNLKNGKLGIINVPYQEIEIARKEHEDELLQFCYFDEKINYDLTIGNLRVLLESFRDGRCYVEKNYRTFEDKERKLNQEEIYGIKVYDKVIEQLYEGNITRENIKTYRIMVDHIKICNVMMKWIRDRGYIDNLYDKEYIEIKNEYEKLLKNTVISQNLYIKLCLSFSETDRERLKVVLEKNKNKEVILIERLLNILK